MGETRVALDITEAEKSQAGATFRAIMVPENISEPGAVGAAPARGQHLVGGAVMAHRTRSVVERITAKVRVADGGCWVWTGSVNPDGYGKVRDGDGRTALVHRVVFALVVGPIPDGFVLDHLCRNRACTNPAHLEVVTRRENSLRGRSSTYDAHRSGTCVAGHPTATEAAFRRGTTQVVYCRACRRGRRRG